MTSERNTRIRFMDNNNAEVTQAAALYSSQLASFPFSNAINKFRSRVWVPSGRFEITESNQNLHVNTGADITAVIDVGEYATPELLATEIENKLNTVSSNWAVTYDRAGETYTFNISNTASVVLRLSNTSDAIWDTIGFTTNIDLTGTAFQADRQRNHYPYEYFQFDFGYISNQTFFAMIAPLDEIFSISTSANVTLMASNLDQWTNPPFTITLDVNDQGIMRFLDNEETSSFRFWRCLVQDRENPGGPNAIRIGHIYLGDYTTMTTRNVSNNFQRVSIDPSRVDISTSGVLHFDRKTQYNLINSVNIKYMERSEKDALREMYNILGKTTPFYVSLDPTLCLTNDLFELTKYCVFNSEPVFKQEIADIFSVSFTLRELV
jgi:hypothetical protein